MPQITQSYINEKNLSQTLRLYNAITESFKIDVEKYGNLPIPLELRNAPTKLMKEMEYGKGYEMYPDQQKNLLPTKLKNKKYLRE